MRPVDLIKLIKAHPKCHLMMDNDDWYLYKNTPHKTPQYLLPEDWSSDDWCERRGQWEDQNLLADSSTPIKKFGRFPYGGSILLVLAEMANMKVSLV